MTKRTDLYLPKSELGNDPHDFRNNPELISSEPSSVLNILDKWVLTEEQEAKAKQGYWLIPNILYHNHACTICAPANAGKTRITFYLMCQLAERGIDVRYINMDINLSDAVVMKRQAEAVGMKFLTPDLSGVPPGEVYEYIVEIARSEDNLSNVVIVIDNLKQIANVIDKHDVKGKMQTLCRTLTGTGATVVILAHTNKYDDYDGNLIYEGTSDIIHMTTELFYMVSDKTANGQTVQLVSEKNRVSGEVKPVSFEIDLEGNVTESLKPVDVQKRKREQKQLASDSEGIAVVRGRLSKSECKQGELVDYLSSEVGMGKQAATRLLKRWVGQPPFWTLEAGENNARIYKKW